MKRFYKDATARREGDGWLVMLDERPVKTAQGKLQIVPSLGLAEAMAAEWRAQGEMLDPRSLPLRDLADLAIDVVAPDPQQTIIETLPFAETDTLCYRGDPGTPLFERQEALWEPLLENLERHTATRFERISGVLHRPQPAETIDALSRELAQLDPFRMAAVRTMASLAASLCIALAALDPDSDPQELWNAANLEEDWQAEQWGIDAEAAAVREAKEALFLTAGRFARLIGE
ncbi:ATP12 family protein [Qipengyuania sp. JC766]|uniref:ATP12 family chaperone protein n=1 Tax=Qipengyuania sp. JC766 TaxID=3232139 RepID=UPI0034591376